MLAQRIRDAAVLLSFPALRRQVHRTRKVGLESLLDYQRLAMVVAATRLTNDLEGDVIEFGTFRGGTAGLILQNLTEGKVMHVSDSFKGMPDVSSRDNFHNEGDFAETDEETVVQGLAQLGGNFMPHVGFFSHTIPAMEKFGPHRLAFAHIDADLYESVYEALEFCYPRMTNGGVMILDDYGAPSCLGAKQAADEFFAERPETLVALSQPSYGCLVGGGDLFEALTRETGAPLSFGIFRSWTFRR